PAPVSCSSPPSTKRTRSAGVFAPLPCGGMYLSRPALIRCTITTISSSSVGSRKRFARRSTPFTPSPSRSITGGSNVFSVAIWAGPAFSIGTFLTSGSSWRRQASTSGNSGKLGSRVGGSDQGNRAPRGRDRGRAPRARRDDRRGQLGRRRAGVLLALGVQADPGDPVRRRLRRPERRRDRNRLRLQPRRTGATRRRAEGARARRSDRGGP